MDSPLNYKSQKRFYLAKCIAIPRPIETMFQLRRCFNKGLKPIVQRLLKTVSANLGTASKCQPHSRGKIQSNFIFISLQGRVTNLFQIVLPMFFIIGK